MIDAEGFRLNIGIILLHPSRPQVLVGKRTAQDHWQFPQGGLQPQENPETALLRELYEELGLRSTDVCIVAQSRQWLCYRLPRNRIKHYKKPLCIGQKQRWFLLRMQSTPESIQLNTSDRPEFDSWRWVDYWLPLDEVIDFKQDVYRAALTEFESVATLSPRATEPPSSP